MNLSRCVFAILCFVAAVPLSLAGWVNATGGSGPVGSTPTFTLEVNDGGTTAPYGFEFIDVYQNGQFIERTGPGGYHPNYCTFTWTDPRGSWYTGTKEYMFGFTAWSPSTSHYAVGIAYASYTIAAPNSPPSVSISADTTTITAGGGVIFTVSGSDAESNLDGLNIDITYPTSGYFNIWYGAYTYEGFAPNNGSYDFSATSSESRQCLIYFPQPGTYQFVGSARDPGGWVYSDSITITVTAPPPPTVTGGVTNGTTSVPFSYQISATENPTGYDASGLPPGLTVNGGTGLISGTPTTAGTWNVVMYAGNAGGTGSAYLTLVIQAAAAPAILHSPLGQSSATIRGISAGVYHSCAVRHDGAAFGWGWNSHGQLGNSTGGLYIPSPPSGVSGLVALAAGYYHTLALTSSGTVLAYGYNGYGQLGDGSAVNRPLPVLVAGLSDVVSVKGGQGHSLALKADGTVWAWGANDRGQVGDGTSNTRVSPVQVSGLTGVVRIAAGGYHNLALKNDGSVWAWGFNATGQLGNGSTTLSRTPVVVASLSGVADVSCGDGHSIARKSDGTVWAWGSNSYGQLGDGSVTQHNAPVNISGLSGVTSVCAGHYSSAAVRNDGTAWSWGQNASGQLADSTMITRYAPTQMVGLTGATEIAMGANHVLVLKSDGTVLAAGDNYQGKLGDGSTTAHANLALVIRLTDCVYAVDASGSPAPTYQWQRKPAGATDFTSLSESSVYSGVTKASLQVANPTTAMNGDEFRCVVTNAIGTVTTTAAGLVIGNSTVTVLGGNNQSALAGTFNSAPFDVAFWNAAGTLPLMGKPVTFSVQSGGGSLATSNTGAPTLHATLTLNTDEDGTVQAFYKQPSTGGVLSQIMVTSGDAQTVFSTTSVTAGVPFAPGWIRTTATTPGSASFSWAAVTGNGASIVGYNVYRDGVRLNGAPQTSTSYTDSAATAGGSHTYTVKAVDSLGAESESISLTVAIPSSSTTGVFEVFTPVL